VLDNVTYTPGRHLFKLGGEFRNLQQNAFRDVQSRGFINFVGFTGNPLAEMLQGFPGFSGGARLDNPQHLVEAGPEIDVDGATVTKVEGPRQWLRFRRDEISAAALIGAIAERVELRDLTIEEPAIEDVVRRIYEQGIAT
jgi:hypothetical protein